MQARQIKEEESNMKDILVIVTQKHNINPRQLLKLHCRTLKPLRRNTRSGMHMVSSKFGSDIRRMPSHSKIVVALPINMREAFSAPGLDKWSFVAFVERRVGG